ncbi:MAG: hypothetical protein OXG81_10415 [Acidobacteria bacterium]|nr:hypothetical protein [Acidobacteriota bacterium]
MPDDATVPASRHHCDVPATVSPRSVRCGACAVLARGLLDLRW